MSSGGDHEASRLDLSFIIPAFNEVASIGHTIESIGASLARQPLRFEVIVVDHGSTDDTCALAQAAGAKVLSAPDIPTIAAVRNYGASSAHGAVLVFLDADVTIASDWGEHALALLAALERDGAVVSGSEVVCPQTASGLQRVWFGVSGKDRSHVNSGHLIVAKAFFDSIGGFDAGLTTAEDFDLSMRAKAQGGSIAPDAALVAYHHGYPDTLRDFFRRELWHGLGAARSLRDLTASKVGTTTLALDISVLLAVPLALWTLWALALPLVALVGISALAGALRRKVSLWHWPAVSALYMVYFAARCCASVARLLPDKDFYWRG